MAQAGETQVEPDFGRQSWESGEAKGLEFAEQREESCTEEPRDPQRVPLAQVREPAGAWGRAVWKDPCLGLTQC